MNETYMRHKVGNKVLFGDVVQLLHVKSKKYLTVKDKVLARDERENTAVFLSPEETPSRGCSCCLATRSIRRTTTSVIIPS